MPIAGFYIPRIGCRTVAAIGGLIVGLGYVLASFANTIGWLTISYGGIAGTGIGITFLAMLGNILILFLLHHDHRDRHQ